MAATVEPVLPLPTDTERLSLSWMQPALKRQAYSFGVKPPTSAYVPYPSRRYYQTLEHTQIRAGDPQMSLLPPVVLTKSAETFKDGSAQLCSQTVQSADEKDGGSDSCVVPNDASAYRSDSNYMESIYLSPTASPCSSSPTLHSSSVPSSEKSFTLKVPCSKFRLSHHYSAVRVVYAINHDRRRSQDMLSVHYPDSLDNQEGGEREVEGSEPREENHDRNEGFTNDAKDDITKKHRDQTVSMQDAVFAENLFKPHDHSAQQRYRRRHKHGRCRFPPVGSALFFLGFFLMPFWWLGSIYLPRPRERAIGADYNWRKRNRVATVYGLVGAVVMVGIFAIAFTRKALSRMG